VIKLFLGISLILVGLFILGSTFLPIIREELGYDLRGYQTPQSLNTLEPIDREFGILIPKINANAHVIKNVNPFKEKEYQLALSQGVAHAKDTALPGQKGNIFIFSHSSSDFFNAAKHNSVFYLLSKLEKEDQIKLFYEDKEYDYSVDNKKIVETDAVEYLTDETKNETLTLMTCWPPGTSLKRLIIQATRL